MPPTENHLDKLTENQLNMMRSLARGVHVGPSYQNKMWDNFLNQAGKDPNFGAKIEALTSLNIGLKIPLHYRDLGVKTTPTGAMTVNISPIDVQNNKPVVDMAIRDILKTTRDPAVVQRLQDSLKGQAPATGAPVPSAAPATGPVRAPQPVEVDRGNRGQTPPVPVQGQFGAAAKNAYTAEIMENARQLHQNIKDQAAQGGVSEARTRTWVMRDREQILKQSLPLAEARHVLSQEKAAERIIDQEEKNNMPRKGIPVSQVGPRIDEKFAFGAPLIMDKWKGAAQVEQTVVAEQPAPELAVDTPSVTKERVAARLPTGPGGVA